MKLRTKFGLMLVAIMLVLSGVVLGSAEFFKQQAEQRERADLESTSGLTAQQIDKIIQTRKGTVVEYAAKPRVENFANSEQYLTTFIQNTRFFGARVIDANYTVRGWQIETMNRSREKEFIGEPVRNRSQRPYLEKTLSDGTSVITRPEWDSTRQRYVMLISAPIGLTANETGAEGVFVAAVTLKEGDFFRFITPLESRAQSVRVVGTERETGDSVVLHEPEQTFDRAFEKNATATAIDWEVTVFRNKDVLTEQLDTLQRVQGVGLVLVLLSLLGLGYWELTTNLRQTNKLLEGFEELEEGHFDFSLSLRAAEEWTQISDGFNRMTGALREREAAIREREQRLAVLNRVLRHNLQNDMSVILTYGEMLPELSEAELEDASNLIVSKGRGLVSHGHKARRVEEAMESAEEGLVDQDAVTLIEEALDDLRTEYPEATVKRDLPETLEVKAISSLRYAIESVSENALEHNDSDDPEIDVWTVEKEGYVHLVIADNGPGIPEYEQQVLTDREETDLEHGSGLGLFLAAWITEKSGGAISFDDSDEDGAIVTLTLASADNDQVDPTLGATDSVDAGA
jgi:signal transduction histidine kinase